MKKKDIEGKYNLTISLGKCAKCDICNGYLNSRGYCRRCLGNAVTTNVITAIGNKLKTQDWLEEGINQTPRHRKNNGSLML